MRCLHRKRVIRYFGGVTTAGVKGEIVAFLLDNANIDLCDACLAFATERSLADVRHVLDELKTFAEFRRQEAICTVCSRLKTVTSAVVWESTPLPFHPRPRPTGIPFTRPGSGSTSTADRNELG
jgi:hypothetical protein